jgi:hypothetical protein
VGFDVHGFGVCRRMTEGLLGYDNFEQILGYDKIIFTNQDYMEVSIMLATENKQESILKRIEQVVSVIMEERPIFKEDLDYSEIVAYLIKLFQKNLPFEEFNAMSNEELKEHCSFIMATELLGKIGEDFTSEQMAIFEDAIKRK